MSDAEQSPTDSPDGNETSADTARRKFREALDRKKASHHGSSGSADPHTAAPHTSPAKPQRTFRRKSG